MKKIKELEIEKLLLSKNPISTTIHMTMSQDIIIH